MTKPNVPDARELKKPSPRSQHDSVFRSDDDGDQGRRTALKAACATAAAIMVSRRVISLVTTPPEAFLRPRPRTSAAVAHRTCQGRALARPRGPDLYKFEHDGILGASGRIPCSRTFRLRPEECSIAIRRHAARMVSSFDASNFRLRAPSLAQRQGPKPAGAETRPLRGSGAPLRRRRA